MIQSLHNNLSTLAQKTLSLGHQSDEAANDVNLGAVGTVIQAISAGWGSSLKKAGPGAQRTFLGLNFLGSLMYGASFLEPVRRFVIGQERYQERFENQGAAQPPAQGLVQKIGRLWGLVPASSAQMVWVALCNAVGPLVAVVGTAYQGPGKSFVRPAAIVGGLGAMLGYAYCQTKPFGDFVTGREGEGASRSAGAVSPSGMGPDGAVPLAAPLVPVL